MIVLLGCLIFDADSIFWYSEVNLSLTCPVYLGVAWDTALSSTAAHTDILIGFNLKALFFHCYLLQ